MPAPMGIPGMGRSSFATAPSAATAGLERAEQSWSGELSEEELGEVARLRAMNASLHEELQRIEQEAVRVEAEVRRGRDENDRVLEEILISSASALFSDASLPPLPPYACPATLYAAAAANSSAPSSAGGFARAPSEAIGRGVKSETDLLVEDLAAQLRAEVQSLWADGREVRSLAARREQELRAELSHSEAEEHAEARTVRRVRDAAARKVAAARRELDAAIREVASARSEQAAAKAAASNSAAKPWMGSIARVSQQARYENPFGEEVFEFPESQQEFSMLSM